MKIKEDIYTRRMQPVPGTSVIHRYEKSMFADVDETLIFLQYPSELEEKAIDFAPFGFQTRALPHWHHVEKIKEFRLRNIGVFVWSQGGPTWAEAVCEALGLIGWVHILPKPDWYLDDKPCQSWMGAGRFYLDITTGKDLKPGTRRVNLGVDNTTMTLEE